MRYEGECNKMLVPKEHFVDSFKKWKGCCNKCVRYQSVCFEEDDYAITIGRLFFLILIGWIISLKTVYII